MIAKGTRTRIRTHMKNLLVATVLLASSAAMAAPGELTHDHPAPEKLGTVHFENSCAAAVQPQFERAIALLHSFSYSLAAKEFEAVASQDPGCAIAHWGIAMTHFHQLWDLPPSASDTSAGRKELKLAAMLEEA